ncbi:MAG: hypothetical protein C4K48_12550 [Candidatus Thorarchaeota archaeon]|nr:MAG: hypothetical protein C4K48_12550 [Candidatus Thorarchaeota archaeon]
MFVTNVPPIRNPIPSIINTAFRKEQISLFSKIHALYISMALAYNFSPGKSLLSTSGHSSGSGEYAVVHFVQMDLASFSDEPSKSDHDHPWKEL